MNQLKELRTEKSMTILELSRKTGVSERYLRFIESGEKTPSLKTAGIIAEALGMSVDDIFLKQKCTKSTK